MVRYTVPTETLGTATRTSAGHDIEAPKYRFVAVHDLPCGGGTVTWHSSYALAAKSSQYGSRVVEVVEIRPEHCSETEVEEGRP
jgi:hypothetical protein